MATGSTAVTSISMGVTVARVAHSSTDAFASSPPSTLVKVGFDDAAVASAASSVLIRTTALGLTLSGIGALRTVSYAPLAGLKKESSTEGISRTVSLSARRD